MLGRRKGVSTGRLAAAAWLQAACTDFGQASRHKKYPQAAGESVHLPASARKSTLFIYLHEQQPLACAAPLARCWPPPAPAGGPAAVLLRWLALALCRLLGCCCLRKGAQGFQQGAFGLGAVLAGLAGAAAGCGQACNSTTGRQQPCRCRHSSKRPARRVGGSRLGAGCRVLSHQHGRVVAEELAAGITEAGVAAGQLFLLQAGLVDAARTAAGDHQRTARVQAGAAHRLLVGDCGRKEEVPGEQLGW